MRFYAEIYADTIQLKNSFTWVLPIKYLSSLKLVKAIGFLSVLGAQPPFSIAAAEILFTFELRIAVTDQTKPDSCPKEC